MEKPPKPPLYVRLRHAFYFRLLSPLVRAKHPPQHAARATAVGLFVSLTPTVGLQMPTIFALWLLSRWAMPRFQFNLIIGLAWTWVTNALTVAPFYYLCFFTGQVMLGRWDDLTGYGAFAAQLTATLDPEVAFIERVWHYTVDLMRRFGLPMFLGCLPWALGSAWLGYRWTIAVAERLGELKKIRRAARLKRRAASRAAKGSMVP